MPLQSLERLLADFQKDPRWRALRRYQEIIQAWRRAIPPEIQTETRLLRLQSNVLWIAVPSAVQAQTLTLRRYPLLTALNAYLPEEPLKDLRFSPLSWRDPSPPAEPAPDQRRSDPDFSGPNPVPADADLKTVFNAWTETLARRAQALPPCPQCQTPALPWELERWNCCAHCARRRWQKHHNRLFKQSGVGA